MDSRVALAVERKASMNCAQAVACTYCDLVGVDAETMHAIAQPFGSGVGGTMKGTCGALTGAAMIVGMALKDKPKAEVVKTMGQIMKDFEAKNGSTICKELKGVGTGTVLRSCPGCVEDASALLEKALFEK